MAHSKRKTSPRRRRPAEAALHAALLRQDRAIPVTPAEVAAFDARHPDDGTMAPLPPPPSLRYSWEPPEPAAAGTVVDFPAAPLDTPMSLAARTEVAVSAATRAKLATLVRTMQQREKPPGV